MPTAGNPLFNTLRVYVHPPKPLPPVRLARWVRTQSREAPRCPSPTPFQVSRRRVRRTRARGSRGLSTRGSGKLPKVPREALVLPHLELAKAARQVPMARGCGARSGARARRLHAPLPGERAQPLPSRLGPRPRARPSRVAPPRPAPPGTPVCSSRAGAVRAAPRPSLAPVHEPFPRRLASDPSGCGAPESPPHWQRDRSRQFRGSSDCLM